MSEAKYNLSKQELLDKIRQNHDELTAALLKLNEQQMTSRGPHPDSAWTMKDVLAHLSAWMQILINRLPGHEPFAYPIEAEAGESEASYMERINQYYYEQSKDTPISKVEAEFDKSYQQVLKELEMLSDEQLAERKLQEIIAEDVYEHFAEHLEGVSGWLEEQEEPLVSKAEVLARLAQGRNDFLAAFSGLSEAQMTTPGLHSDSNWTVKDTLAHCAEWMRATPPRLPGGSGNAFPIAKEEGEDPDHFTDRVNEYWYQQDKDKPLAMVREDFDAAYRQIADAVEALSDEQIAERTTQYRIGSNTYWHFAEHLEYIKDWLKQQKQG